MNLPQEFEEAAARAKELPNQPNDVLLDLYALYKQATKGDAGDDKPSMFDMVGRAKYEAWKTRRGMPLEEAMQAYIELVGRLAE